MVYSQDSVAAMRSQPIAWRSYATGASFNTSDGILTINMTATDDVTVDLDGRYGVGGGVSSGLKYAVGYYATAGTTITGNTTLFVSGTRVGIRTDNPDKALHVNDNDAAIKLTYYADQSKYSLLTNTTAGVLNISTTANQVNVDGFNIASTAGAAITEIKESTDSESSSDTAIVTEGWINTHIVEGTGSVGTGTQYNLAYYATAGSALSDFNKLTTDASDNLILSGTSNIAKTVVDFQHNLGVSGSLSVSGAATFLEPVTINNVTGVGISATGTNNFKGSLIQEGTSLLSGNTTITGSVSTTTSATIGSSANIGTTLLATGAATLKSTVNVGSTLVATGATTLKSTLDVGSNTQVTGNVNILNNGRNQMQFRPNEGSAYTLFTDSGTTATAAGYYPRLWINNDATDGAEYADYPSIYFTKYGPKSALNVDQVAGWRQAASGTSGDSIGADQYMVWDYNPDTTGLGGVGANAWSNRLTLKSDGTLTSSTFAGELAGTITSATTATTQSSSDNSTKVATTAYADAAASGGGISSPLTTKGDIWVYTSTNARLGVGTNADVLTADSSTATGLAWATPTTGTIGGSIAEDRIAVGTSTANTITGTSKFEWDDATLTMTNAGDTAITLLGDANRSGENSHAMAMRGKWDGTAIGTVMIATGPDTTNKDDGQILFYTASAGTQTERMRIDETGNVGIGTTAPDRKLHVYSSDSMLANFESSSDTAMIRIRDNDTYAQIGVKDAKMFLGYSSSMTTSNLVLTNINDVVKVGIGTIAPAYNLDVVGTTQLSGAATVTGLATLSSMAMGGNTVDDILLAADTVSTADDELVSAGYINARYAPVAITGTIGGSITDNQVAFGASSANSIEGSSTFIFDGSLGVGTASPANRIEAYGTGHEKVIATSTGDTHAVGFQAEQDADGTSQKWQMQTEAGGTGFQIRDATDGRVDMHFDGTGEVGIGTTAPTRTLDVRGRSFVSGATDVVPFEVFAYGAGTSALHITSGSDIGIGTATPLAKVHINAGAYQQVYQRDTHYHTIVKGNSDDRLIFATGAPGSHTTRFSILSTGVDVVNNAMITGTLTTTGVATLGDNSVSNTQSAGNNTTRLATTAFVTTAVAAHSATPPGGSDTQIQFNNGGAFGGVSGFTTTDDGSDVTLTSATASKPVFMIQNTNADANSGELQFYKSTTDEATNDYAGKLSFYFDNDAAQKTLGAKIYSTAQAVTDGTEGGYLYFSTMKAGTETVTMTMKSGNIGFGDTSPGYQYHFSDRTSADTNILYAGNTADWLFQNKTDGSLLWKQNTDGVSAMTILSGGNVGIGTTSPARKLHVYSGSNEYAARFEDGIELDGTNVQLLGYGQGNLWMMGNSGNPKLTLGYSHNWDFAVSLQYIRGATGGSSYAGDGELKIGQLNKNNANWDHGITSFYVSGSEAMRLSKDGYLGIGTTSPSAPLHLYKADGWSAGQNWMQWIQNAEATDDYNYGLRISAGSTGNDTAFFVQDHDASNDYFVIRGDGDVGIGTTAPTNLLTVSGNASPLRLYGTSTGKVEFDVSTSGDFTIDADDDIRLDPGGNDVVLYGAGTEYGRLTYNGGHMSISTTTQFQVDSGDDVNLDAHSSVFNFKRQGTEMLRLTAGASTPILWSTKIDDYSTRWADYDDVTQLFLEHGGNVGIGTTTPAQLLDVSGSQKLYGSFNLANGAITSNPGTNHLWASGATLFWGTSQIGTTTPGAGAIEGTATAGEIAYGDGSNSITSTSNFTFTDDVGMTIQSSVSDKPVITLKNTNANNSAPLLDFIKDSASPLASDDLAGIRFYGDDAGGAQHNFARIDVESPVVTAGAEVGSIKFRTTDGGTDNTGVMILSGSNVGIGTISPAYELDLNGKFYWDGNHWRGADTNGPSMRNETPSATNPVFTFNNDVDTGIGRAAADTLSLIAGGYETVRLANDGSYSKLFLGGDSTLGFYRYSNRMDFYISSSPRLHLDASKLYSETSGGPLLDLTPTAGEANYGFVDDADSGLTRSAANTIHLLTAGVSGMTMDSSQNVGIGTTAPDAPLHILKAAGGANIITGLKLDPDDATVNSGISIDFNASSTNTGASLVGSRIIGAREGGNASGFLALYTSPDAIGSVPLERMRITSAGNVGIGTTAPNAPLDVYNTSTQQRWSYNGSYYTDMTVESDGDTTLQAKQGSLSLKTDTGGKTIRLDSKGDVMIDLGGSAGTYLMKVVDSSANWLFTTHDNGNVGIHTGSLQIKERAAAPSDAAAYGQFWVKTATPNKPYFTDDAGTDFDLTAGEANVFSGAVPDTYIPMASGGADILRGFLPAYVDVTTDNNVFLGTIPASLTGDADQNTSFGHLALENLTTGDANTAVGMNAGNDLTQGYYNTFIGYSAGGWKTTEIRNTAVGYAAGSKAGGGDNVSIGAWCGYGGTGDYNVLIGSEVAYNATSINRCVVIGRQAANAGTFSGNENVLIGYKSGYAATSGKWNTAVGTDTMGNMTTASGNIAVGYQAGVALTTGTNNVFVGRYAGKSTTTVNYNTYIGDSVGKSGSTADKNTAIGNEALLENDTGGNNTAIGYQTLYNTTDSCNVALGHQAGKNNTSGGGNVFIGCAAGPSSTNTDDNKLYIHNAEGTPLIAGDFSAGTVTINGVLSATAKSFNIPHPLYKDKRLVHGSLEGPEHGLYIRGTIEAFKGCLIELPEYWSAMCEDYTVQLTPHGAYTVFIKEKQKDKVMIGCSEENYKFDYYIVGARTDETLEVVQDA